MTTLQEPPTTSRVLLDLSHGEHAHRARSADAAGPEAVAGERSGPVGTPFGYLFTHLAAAYPSAHLPTTDPAAVVAGLTALGAAMVEDPPLEADPLQPASGSTIPPIYTYWGQFIDHDLTANTDRDDPVGDITASPLVPADPDDVVAALRNLRQPALNLDSLYGDGPGSPASAHFYAGPKFGLGSVALQSNDPARPIAGERIPPVDDLERDLPRIDRQAQIGDGRNDENLVVAQLHVAFLRFHNAVVDWVLANEPTYVGDEAVFERARQLTRWHYQWLVVHDYLTTICLPGVPDKVLLAGNRHYEPRDGEVYMPLEFSVAAFRFGHSMVRAVYDWNRNFGRPGRGPAPSAPFFLLFLFTGKSSPAFGGDTDVLPFNWVVEWDRMTDKGAVFPDRFARKIDTRLAPPLRDLANEGTAPGTPPGVRTLLRRLATRNLLRGYALAIPTGQAVATALGVPPLSSRELQRDNNAVLNDALREGGFLAATPLWFYVLKEAEVHGNGNSLGEVGSRLVAETIIGQVRYDPGSYLHQPYGWGPEQGVQLPDGDPIVTIRDLLRFAGVL